MTQIYENSLERKHAMGSTSQTAVDLSHHINAKSKGRHPSPLKDIIKFMGYEGMISLAGGMINFLGSRNIWATIWQ